MIPTQKRSAKRRRLSRWQKIAIVAVPFFAILPSYFRVFTAAGGSDAPAICTDDTVLASFTSYDLRIPYSDRLLFSHSEPRIGDMIVFSRPGTGETMFKRLVAGPGDLVELRDNRLYLNGEPVRYSPVSNQRPGVPGRNKLGSIVYLQELPSGSHIISFSPHSKRGDFGPVQLDRSSYWVIGDNRDNSVDSRDFGPIPRANILGKIIAVLNRAN